jgi:hypothetical protein
MVDIDLNKDHHTDASADANVAIDASGSVDSKSPSFLRKVATFFHVHSAKYDMEKSSKKRHKKTSTDKSSSIDMNVDSSVNVNRDDSFTIPEGNISFGGSTNVDGDAKVGLNHTAPSADLKLAADTTTQGSLGGGAKGGANGDLTIPNGSASASLTTSLGGGLGGGTTTAGSADVSLPSVGGSVDTHTDSSAGGNASLGGGLSLGGASASIGGGVSLGGDASIDTSANTDAAASLNTDASVTAGVGAEQKPSESGSFDVDGKAYEVSLSLS